MSGSAAGETLPDVKSLTCSCGYLASGDTGHAPAAVLDIATTATFTGSVEVCIPYADLTLSGPARLCISRVARGRT